MLNAVRNGDDPAKLYCTACFTGRYPVVEPELVGAGSEPAQVG